MKKIILIMLILFLTCLPILFIIRGNILGEQINSIEKLPYTHTKAICNETNYCQDYEIECQGNQLIKMSPITGAFAQYSKNWQDPRNEKDILC